MPKSHTHPCPRCGGTGALMDRQGAALKKLRLAYGMSQHTMAQILDISAAYLCDLEQDRRNWSPELIAKFQRAIRS